MRIASKYYRMLLVALNDPGQWVAQVTYLDGRARLTNRAISPLRMETDQEGGSMLVMDLGSDGLRTLVYVRVLRVQLRLSSDVLPPEGVRVLVDHPKRMRWASDEPFALG